MRNKLLCVNMHRKIASILIALILIILTHSALSHQAIADKQNVGAATPHIQTVPNPIKPANPYLVKH
jgi:hypothetical protein